MLNVSSRFPIPQMLIVKFWFNKWVASSPPLPMVLHRYKLKSLIFQITEFGFQVWVWIQKVFTIYACRVRSPSVASLKLLNVDLLIVECYIKILNSWFSNLKCQFGEALSEHWLVQKAKYIASVRQSRRVITTDTLGAHAFEIPGIICCSIRQRERADVALYSFSLSMGVSQPSSLSSCSFTSRL